MASLKSGCGAALSSAIARTASEAVRANIAIEKHPSDLLSICISATQT